MGDFTLVELATLFTGVASTVTAVVALVLARRTDLRSREALKVQTYLQLRSEFLKIYPDLGQLDDPEPKTNEQGLARAAYWHHAWDEWYITKKLAPSEFGVLWDDFFVSAARGGISHAALRTAFTKLKSDKESGFRVYASDLIEEVQRLEREAAASASSDGAQGASRTGPEVGPGSDA